MYDRQRIGSGIASVAIASLVLSLHAGSLCLAGGWFDWFSDKGEIDPDFATVELRNESNLNIVSERQWTRCPKVPGCRKCGMGSGAGYGKGIEPGEYSRGKSSAADQCHGITLGLSDGRRLVKLLSRDDLRNVAVGELCIVTVTKELQLTVEYSAKQAGDPPIHGVTIVEPLPGSLAPSQAVIVRVTGPGEEAVVDAKTELRIECRDPWYGRCGESDIALKEPDGSYWIPLTELSRFQAHLPEEGNYSWELVVSHPALGWKSFTFDPSKPAEILCKFAKPAITTLVLPGAAESILMKSLTVQVAELKEEAPKEVGPLGGPPRDWFRPSKLGTVDDKALQPGRYLVTVRLDGDGFPDGEGVMTMASYELSRTEIAVEAGLQSIALPEPKCSRVVIEAPLLHAGSRLTVCSSKGEGWGYSHYTLDAECRVTIPLLPAGSYEVSGAISGLRNTATFSVPGDSPIRLDWLSPKRD